MGKPHETAREVTAVLRDVLGTPGEAGIALHEPEFGGAELRYVSECIETGWVSSVGRFVDRFEEDLASRTGVARAIAVVNGTAALQLSLLLAGVRAGDEVLVPALTFIATANAVSYVGAVPHFVDSEPERLGIDPLKLRAYLQRTAVRRDDVWVNRETGRPLRALVVLHVFGHAADLVGLQAVADEFDLPLVEDAAEALGSELSGRHLGGFGCVGALSFNGNKVVTTGGGGAVLTNDEALGHRAKHLSTTARVAAGWEFVHDEVGFNYRMPNLNAALGVAQLERLDDFVSRKRQLAERYHSAFAGLDRIETLREPEGARGNYWLNAILVPDRGTRDAVLQATNDAGYMTRPCWTLMHRLAPYAECPRDDLRCAEDTVDRLVNIPSSPALAEH